MTVESNYAIAIATLSDWLKRLAPVFQPMRSKTKTIAPCTRDFFRVLSELQVIARNCDWSIAVFAPIVIDRSNPLVLVFRRLFENFSIAGSIHNRQTITKSTCFETPRPHLTRYQRKDFSAIRKQS